MDEEVGGFLRGNASSARVPLSFPLSGEASKLGPDASEAKSFRFYYPLLKQSSHDVGRAHRSTLAPNFTLLPPPGGRARATRAAPGTLDFSVLPPSALANTLSATELTGYTAPLPFQRDRSRDIRYPFFSSVYFDDLPFFLFFFLLLLIVFNIIFVIRETHNTSLD